MSADLIDYLNLVISQAAAKAGVRYVDVSHAFDGHRMCEAISSQVAVNGFTAGTDGGVGPIKFVGTESYHPNALGHQLLANTIRTQTNNFQTLCQSPTLPYSRQPYHASLEDAQSAKIRPANQYGYRRRQPSTRRVAKGSKRRCRHRFHEGNAKGIG